MCTRPLISFSRGFPFQLRHRAITPTFTGASIAIRQPVTERTAISDLHRSLEIFTGGSVAAVEYISARSPVPAYPYSYSIPYLRLNRHLYCIISAQGWCTYDALMTHLWWSCPNMVIRITGAGISPVTKIHWRETGFSIPVSLSYQRWWPGVLLHRNPDTLAMTGKLWRIHTLDRSNSITKVAGMRYK